MAPCSILACTASPPNSTVSPAASAVRPAASSARWSSSVSSIASTEYATVAYAVVPSGETAPLPNGSVTWATPGSACIAATACFTPVVAAGVVTAAPSSATKTTRADAPAAPDPGIRSSSRSRPCWASVPGIVNESDVGPDRVTAPAPARASSRSQAARTVPRRRNENRPSR